MDNERTILTPVSRLAGRLNGFTSLFLGDCIRRALCWALVRLAQVAIKFVSKDVAEEELDLPGWGRVPLEVAVMTLTNEGPECSNVLKLLDWFNQKSRYIMVLERLEPCQDLSAFCDDHGGRVGECFTRVVMKQLLNALIHCQRRGVLHRDVKPENVLINPDSLEIRLIDFGCGDLLQTSVYEYFSGSRWVRSVPGITGRKVGIHPGGGTSPSQSDTYSHIHSHTHTYGHV
ncbi:serine/threonine-protein kinase pim-1-like isoform X2 [Hoplias malabaricus]|uniref:serine/threonine-protein kinase pim-1-like isoform X2 n=1 Tax=Hoplias malabaricus TaxID=27720 RepID=UPI003462460F